MTRLLSPPRTNSLVRNAHRWIALLAGIFATSCTTATPPVQYASDFDRFCTDIGNYYAYFDQKPIDWVRACTDLRPLAQEAHSREAFVAVLEKTLGELHDFHAHLATSNEHSPRLVPTDSDLRARWIDDHAVITDVRAGSRAEKAGARRGMQIADIDGRVVADAIAERQPHHLRAQASPEEVIRAKEWALNQLLAGKQDHQAVRLTCGYQGSVYAIQFVPGIERPEKPLTAQTMDDIGYIRIHNSLGDEALIAAFDSALDALRGKRGLILDLRDTPSGGTSTVARGLMSRFVDTMRAYQMHEAAEERTRTGVRRVWIEQVLPRGQTWTAPVVVLVGAWTGSMGEGIAIGMNATVKAPVVGEPMAGLLGALDELTLPTSGITVRIPTERLFHVNGTRREAFKPCPAAPSEETTDAELAYALDILHQKREPCAESNTANLGDFVRGVF